MIEFLEFIFAVALFVIAFKLTLGCMKVMLWFFGIMLFLSALASILI